MTISEVRTHIRDIASSAYVGHDAEAHGREDELFELVLGEIAQGKISKREIVGLAKAALRSKKLVFRRFCA